jgi:hypothetical protein
MMGWTGCVCRLSLGLAGKKQKQKEKNEDS